MNTMTLKILAVLAPFAVALAVWVITYERRAPLS